MNKKTLLVIGGIVLVLGVCACVAIGGFVLYKVGQQAADVVPTIEAAVTEIPATLAAPTQAPEKNETAPTAEPEAVRENSNHEGVNVANEFLSDLADKKYKDAVSLTNSKLRNFGNADNTAEQLRALVEDKGLEPDIWEWLKTAKDGQYINMDGVVHLADKRRGTVSVQVVYEEDQWRVSYLDLKTDGSEIDPGPYNKWTEDRTKEEVAFAKGAANGFLIYWQDKDFDGTWLMTAQPMKDSLDNEQQKLQDFLTGLNVNPDDWTWEEGYHMIEQEGENHPVIEFKGNVKYQEGSSGPIKIQMKWEEGYWSVMYIDLKAN